MTEIRPQHTQEQFLKSSADIAIFGGSAGGGKTYSVLIEALRHTSNKDFGAVFFRRESTQITNEGGLWDTASEIYPLLDAEMVSHPSPIAKFPSGAKISFKHLNQEKTIYAYQGAQIPLIIFDELTHFTKKQFMYMLSRNRSACGVKPYIRATTNPDPDSWVADFIKWWIDQDTGLAIYERSGVIRWFYVIDDTFIWGDTKEELIEKYGHIMTADNETVPPKSATFILSSIHDNKELLRRDPGYLSNLMALDRVDRERLLHGNWKVRASSGEVFKKEWFEIVDAVPATSSAVRAWDLAASEPTASNPDPDYSVGLRGVRDASGIFYITDRYKDRVTAGKVNNAIKWHADNDGVSCTIRLPQDPGQAGKSQVSHMSIMLSGYHIITKPVTGDKLTRAKPASAQAEHGNIKLLRGDWNDDFLRTLEAFPSGLHDDDIDALSDLIDELSKINSFFMISG
jgi:predicted phage terminase large subunit-like protein